MMNEFQETLNKVNTFQQTENGATGYSTTGKILVDLNFCIPSNHNNTDRYISKFCETLNEDMVTTVKWLFYLRDIREGLGERDSFINLFLTFYHHNQEAALKVLPLIPVYGRWKDLIDLLSNTTDDMAISKEIYSIITKQIKEDCINMKEGKSVSLLAKWMPSINASKKSRLMALRISKKMGLYSMAYRKMLSTLRSYIDVTEVKTCGNKWNEIDYNKVSSNANARYLKAFLKHDTNRRQKYLDDLASPSLTGAVMHASNLYPYEVYAKYNKDNFYICDYKKATPDQGIEALWENLKDIPTMGNTMVVCDGSGSMMKKIGVTNIMAIDVSRSLSIFFSERNTGEYKDKIIEFSEKPRYIDLSNCKTLADKYNTMNRFDDCSNTNLECVFDLLLQTAITNKIPQDDIPKRILIVSDMEFDRACEYTSMYDHNYVMSKYQSLFDSIKGRWTSAGYKMPNIVFWNVNSRTQTVPVTSNEAGITLVSGFSANNAKMILSGEMNPWNALKSVLDSDRYTIIGEILSPEGKKEGK